jgi:hypothetical protein
MRSDLVFSALVRVPNRHMLCALASKATRALHRPGRRIQDTTSDVLLRFGRSSSIADLQATSARTVVSTRQNGKPFVRRASGAITVPPMNGESRPQSGSDGYSPADRRRLRGTNSIPSTIAGVTARPLAESTAEQVS